MCLPKGNCVGAGSQSLPGLNKARVKNVSLPDLAGHGNEEGEKRVLDRTVLARRLLRTIQSRNCQAAKALLSPSCFIHCMCVCEGTWEERRTPRLQETGLGHN